MMSKQVVGESQRVCVADWVRRLESGVESLKQFHQRLLELLEPGDYVDLQIGGRSSRVLTKAGAEKIVLSMGHRFGDLQCRYSHLENANLHVSVQVSILDESDTVLCTGVGEATTLESRYSRNPRDYWNTVAKMALKRAMVSATISAYGLSGLFTQDLDDSPPAPDDERVSVVGSQSPRKQAVSPQEIVSFYNNWARTKGKPTVQRLDEIPESVQSRIKEQILRRRGSSTR